MRLFERLREWLRPQKPDSVAVILLLLFGIPFCILVPIGAGTDEETHAIRAWDIAGLHFIPNEVSRNERPFPAFFWNESYRRRLLIRPLGPDYFAEHASLPIDAEGYIYDALPTRSVYSPPLLLPQALAMRYLAHKWHLSAMTVYAGARLAGLLAYTVLVWLAVKLMPFGKWTTVAVALLPSSVFQASTIGADPIAVGLALVFVAGTLSMARRESLGWAHFFLLLALGAMLFTSKVNLTVLALLPFLVLLPPRFSMKGGYLLLIVAFCVLGALEVVGWAAIAYPRLRAAGLAQPVGQALFALQHPSMFPMAVLREIATRGAGLVERAIAYYGYDYGMVPAPVHLLAVAALTSSVLQDGVEGSPSTRTRRSLAALMVIGILATFAALYLADTPVGHETIEGVQGRYLTPFIFVGLLALIGLPGLARGHPSRWTIGLLSSALLLYGFGLVLNYYVPCGQALAGPGLCYQPQYKNLAPWANLSKSIDPDFSLTQEIVPECNGVAEVNLWVDASGASENGSTTFVLRDPDDDLDRIRKEVPNADLPHGGWYAMTLEPDWNAQGNLYLLSILAGAESQGDGVKIGLSLREEYPGVKLFENGVAASVDIQFRYGCIAGWRALLEKSKESEADAEAAGQGAP